MSRGKEVKELREKMGMNRREFSELDAQFFYSKKEHMFTSGAICAKIQPWVVEKTTESEKRVIREK